MSKLFKIRKDNVAFLLAMVLCLFCTTALAQTRKSFDPEQDLLLLHYDFKTDVDDLHAAAAFATLKENPNFSNIAYHVVAGTYGIQEGHYVPPNTLCELAFKNHWSDAHADFGKAVDEVKTLVLKCLDGGGDFWIAEGGQSDFSSAIIGIVLEERPKINAKNRIHLIQHSDWNEEVTGASSLLFVKQNVDYQKVPDGNAEANGTPGFRSEKKIDLEQYISDVKPLKIWLLAIQLANEYNGVDGRYLNEAIKAGGLDFSDFSEVCWILGIEHIKDADEFFADYAE